ncbi:MAG: extracellular matrix regulator RemB [Bacillota bacterium]
MFLHLGGGNMISSEEVVLIADLEKTTTSDITKEFMSISDEEGFIVDYSGGDPRSFVLTGETIYLSMISSKTLASRVDKFIEENGGY